MAVVQYQVPPSAGDTAEYRQSMIDKFDSLQPKAPASESKPEEKQEQKTDEQPKLYAGKYKSVEDLEKGYQELQKLMGKKSAQSQAPEQKEEKPAETTEKKPEESEEANPEAKAEEKSEEETTAAKAEEQAKEVLEEKGLDISEFTTEYAKAGQLSEDSFAKLEKAGIPRDMVESYIAGQTALAERQTAELQAIVGGEEDYAKLIQWAGANLSEQEAKDYNKALEGTVGQAKLAIEGLYAKYKEANPEMLYGQRDSAGGAGYQSMSEVTKDMADPRYKSDASFRQQVMQKLSRSKL